MPISPLSVVMQHLLADLRPDGDGMTDGELLASFLRSHDHDALAALVRRHAPMVWGVSSRLLPNHDAEDAFQATFLVLVRKAADVPRQAVANWLYGVARQTAVRLRATQAKKGRRETQVVNMPEPGVSSQGSGVRQQEWTDVRPVLDEELGRLPEHYRGVIVLCDLEGMTRKEAARQLGIPEGSVASRLARARVMLAKRLSRRGVAFSGGSVAAALSAGPASASAPAALVASTIKAVTLVATKRAAATGVISAKVAALTDGVVKAMFVTKIKAALSVVLILGVVATGATLLTYGAASGQDDKKPIAEKSVPLPAKLEKEKDEEAFTAWGKEIDGMQAGLGFRPGEHRAYHAGETVKLVVRVRNFGKEAVTFQYLRHFFIENPPTVVDDKGKAVALKDGAPKGIYKPVDVTLAAGKEIELYELTFSLAEKNADPPQLSTLHGKGKFQLKYERILGESVLSSLAIHIGPGLRKLATGKLELEVKEKPPAAKTDEERMVGGWVIVKNDGERKRKGELWSIGKHQIVMNANLSGFRGITHFHRLDAAKNPKQIDITVTGIAGVYGPDVPIKADARIVGVIKGIYAFTDDNELRLCLGELGKDRPTEFAGKPGQSEFLILHGGDPEAWQRKVEKEKLAADLKPKNESAQALFARWQASARTDGKIPGALIGQLARDIDNFLKRYPENEGAPAIAKLRPRLDATHDWNPADAVALLDDITAGSTAPVSWTELALTFAEMRKFKAGQPLPEELKSAAWGAPEANGLRAAWLLEPRAKEYAVGTVFKARVLFHNTGKEPVVFGTDAWHQWDEHKARDAKGTALHIARKIYSGLTLTVTYRLAPGEYCEVLGHKIGIGVGDAAIAAKAGDEVTLTHEVDAVHGAPTSDPEVWKNTVAARVEREGPMPKAAADREQLIRRVTLDIFSVPASEKEIAAFVEDNAADALAKLTERLQGKPRLEPWAGRLPTGETRFRVIAAEPK